MTESGPTTNTTTTERTPTQWSGYPAAERKQRQRFATLQARLSACDETERTYRAELTAHYSEYWYAPNGKRKRLTELENRSQIANAAFFGFLAGLSPRDWSHVIPYSWIVEHLTYDQAVSRDRLTLTAPPAYGYTTYDVERFSAAVQQERGASW